MPCKLRTIPFTNLYLMSDPSASYSSFPSLSEEDQEELTSGIGLKCNSNYSNVITTPSLNGVTGLDNVAEVSSVDVNSTTDNNANTENNCFSQVQDKMDTTNSNNSFLPQKKPCPLNLNELFYSGFRSAETHCALNTQTQNLFNFIQTAPSTDTLMENLFKLATNMPLPSGPPSVNHIHTNSDDQGNVDPLDNVHREQVDSQFNDNPMNNVHSARVDKKYIVELGHQLINQCEKLCQIIKKSSSIDPSVIMQIPSLLQSAHEFGVKMRIFPKTGKRMLDQMSAKALELTALDEPINLIIEATIKLALEKIFSEPANESENDQILRQMDKTLKTTFCILVYRLLMNLYQYYISKQSQTCSSAPLIDSIQSLSSPSQITSNPRQITSNPRQITANSRQITIDLQSLPPKSVITIKL